MSRLRWVCISPSPPAAQQRPFVSRVPQLPSPPPTTRNSPQVIFGSVNFSLTLLSQGCLFVFV